MSVTWKAVLVVISVISMLVVGAAMTVAEADPRSELVMDLVCLALLVGNMFIWILGIRRQMLGVQVVDSFRVDEDYVDESALMEGEGWYGDPDADPYYDMRGLEGYFDHDSAAAEEESPFSDEEAYLALPYEEPPFEDGIAEQELADCDLMPGEEVRF